jgi:hypothetical protein
MSFKLVDKVLKSRNVVKGTPKLVLIAMAARANNDGSEVYPSIKSLADDCGVTRDTIYECLEKLISLGIVTDTGKTKFWGRGHYTNVYQINGSTLCTGSTVSSGPTVSNLPPMPALDSVDSLDATQSGVRKSKTTRSKTSFSKRGRKWSPVCTMEPKSGEATAEPTAETVQSAKTDPVKMQELLGDYPVGRAYDLIQALGCNPDQEAEFSAFLSCLKVFAAGHDPNPELGPYDDAEVDLWSFWQWNQQHKSGGLLFYDLAQAYTSLQSTKRVNALTQWKKHQSLPTCPKRCEFVPFPTFPSDKLYLEAADHEPVQERETPTQASEIECQEHGRHFDVGCEDCLLAENETVEAFIKATSPSSSAPLPNSKDDDLSRCGLFYTDKNWMCELPDRHIGATRPHRKLVDMVAGRRAFEIEEDLG